MKIDFILDEGSSEEDSYLIKDNIFGVFDGYNSLNRFSDRDGKTGGLIASTIAKNEFSKNNKSLLELALEANRKIGESMSISKIDKSDKRNIWGVAAAVVRIKPDSFEWIQVQDSLILIIDKDNNFELLNKDYDHDRSVLIEWKKLAEQKKENIRELLNDSVVDVRNGMNVKYGTLNGDENLTPLIKGGEEGLQNIKHILLFTDGLFIPKKDPSMNDDWDSFVKLFLAEGLKGIRNLIRRLEKGDPKCWEYPRFKQYDDIAAISISF